MKLIIGVGKKKPKPGMDRHDDLYGEEKAAAGKALAAAIRHGDGEEIADAFKALLDACKDAKEDAEMAEDLREDRGMSDDEDEGDEESSPFGF